jgi:hypothetical protein
VRSGGLARPLRLARARRRRWLALGRRSDRRRRGRCRGLQGLDADGARGPIQRAGERLGRRKREGRTVVAHGPIHRTDRLRPPSDHTRAKVASSPAATMPTSGAARVSTSRDLGERLAGDEPPRDGRADEGVDDDRVPAAGSLAGHERRAGRSASTADSRRPDATNRRGRRRTRPCRPAAAAGPTADAGHARRSDRRGERRSSGSCAAGTRVADRRAVRV